MAAAKKPATGETVPVEFLQTQYERLKTQRANYIAAAQRDLAQMNGGLLMLEELLGIPPEQSATVQLPQHEQPTA